MTDLNNFDSINIIFNEISERYFEKIGAPETWEILRRPQFGTFRVPRSSMIRSLNLLGNVPYESSFQNI
jgi:hypothetical protein